MTNCPCCSTPMLRHIRQQQVYWFCRECWQEMPFGQAGLNSVSTALERHLNHQDYRDRWLWPDLGHDPPQGTIHRRAYHFSPGLMLSISRLPVTTL
ncbi:MAG: hypothetical protein NW220_01515 [Leptolyngbyaceae cyanobacterium bins.349]|nr:hypothetical protein [Leptolyngbyaceae cyanobacterium bins.349]